MEQLLFSLNATIPVFLVMVIGYVLQQLHVTNDSFVKTLNSFNYKITLPVLLFKDMSTADFYSVWDTGYVLFCFFVTLFCIVITWVVAGIFYKNKSRLGELVQASYRSSAAVLGRLYPEHLRELRHGSLDDRGYGSPVQYRCRADPVLHRTGCEGLR